MKIMKNEVLYDVWQIYRKEVKANTNLKDTIVYSGLDLETAQSQAESENIWLDEITEEYVVKPHKYQK